MLVAAAPPFKDAFSGQCLERITGELCIADPSIQAVQNIVPVAVGNELSDGACTHATPVSVPAIVPAINGDLALGGLVVRVGFDGAVTPAEVLEEHGDRVKPRRAGDD